MEKINKILIVVEIFLAIGILALIAVQFNTGTITGQVISDLESNAESTVNQPIVNQPKTIEGIYWDHMPITWNFDNKEVCGDYQANRIERAFNAIQEETNNIIQFKKVEGNARDITVYCEKNLPVSESPGFYITGETKSRVDGNKIVGGDIYFYNTGKYTYSGGCVSYPNTEIHEILHLFGFKHVDERFHIMNLSPTYCPSRINSDVIEKLIEVYSG